MLTCRRRSDPAAPSPTSTRPSTVRRGSRSPSRSSASTNSTPPRSVLLSFPVDRLSFAPCVGALSRIGGTGGGAKETVTSARVRATRSSPTLGRPSHLRPRSRPPYQAWFLRPPVPSRDAAPSPPRRSVVESTSTDVSFCLPPSPSLLPFPFLACPPFAFLSFGSGR